MSLPRRKIHQEMAKRNTKNDYLVSRRLTRQCGTKMSGRPTSWEGRKYLYYYCPANDRRIVERECDNKFFRVDQVDAAVWEWVKEILLHTEALREDLKEQQAKREQENQPLRDRLSVIDDLTADNRGQLTKLLDLYLAGDFPKEVLTERKARLEATIKALGEGKS